MLAYHIELMDSVLYTDGSKMISRLNWQVKFNEDTYAVEK